MVLTSRLVITALVAVIHAVNEGLSALNAESSRHGWPACAGHDAKGKRELKKPAVEIARQPCQVLAMQPWFMPVLALLLLSGCASEQARPDHAALLVCKRNSNFIRSPLAPDAATAASIYLAVEKAIPNKSDIEHYHVKVVDDGDHWTVFRYHLPEPAPDGFVTVFAGGGQLEMRIDKCTAAISHAGYSR